MPLIWKLDGIWLSAVAAEFMAVVVTTAFLFKKRKNYKYF
jgi:Na+-driven multidrug efflux pump